MAVDVLNFMGEVIDSQWTLFLDRDGVINERLPGKYIKHKQDFRFKSGFLTFLERYHNIFAHIIIVTNQQGIAKGLMTEDDLALVHDYMLASLRKRNIHIDHIYYCKASNMEEMSCRKPNPTMGLWAKLDFPDIIFSKSIMIGDSISDMLFAQSLGMKTILVMGKKEESKAQESLNIDLRVESLSEISF